MRRLFLLIYIAGSFFVGSSQAFGTVTKLRITHTHSVEHHDDSEHHHHDEDKEDHEANHEPGSSDSGTSHTHEILVVSGVCFILRAAPTIALETPSADFPEPIESRPPCDPNIHSIFRPPIA